MVWSLCIVDDQVYSFVWPFVPYLMRVYIIQLEQAAYGAIDKLLPKRWMKQLKTEDDTTP